MINKFNNAKRMVYETLNFMYIEIYVYLSFIYPNSKDNKYNFSEVDNKFIYVRKIIDKILNYQDNINKMLGHPDFKDFLQSQFIEMINMAYDDSVLNIFNDKNEYTSRFNLRFKFTAYNSIGILNKETNQIDLFKLLEEDAKSSDSKEAKKYFEISENDNNMEIQDYLFYHDLSKEEKDMTDEESVIKSTIDTLFGDLEYNLERFYFEVSLYCFFQTDFDFVDITDKIVQISIFQNKIEELISVYFNEDSSLLIYKSINEINDRIYKEKLESLYKDPNITFTSEDESRYNRYKDFILVSHSNISLYSLLKEDAYTDAAKKYFNKD